MLTSGKNYNNWKIMLPAVPKNWNNIIGFLPYLSDATPEVRMMKAQTQWFSQWLDENQRVQTTGTLHEWFDTHRHKRKRLFFSKRSTCDNNLRKETQECYKHKK